MHHRPLSRCLATTIRSLKRKVSNRDEAIVDVSGLFIGPGLMQEPQLLSRTFPDLRTFDLTNVPFSVSASLHAFFSDQKRLLEGAVRLRIWNQIRNFIGAEPDESLAKES